MSQPGNLINDAISTVKNCEGGKPIHKRAKETQQEPQECLWGNDKRKSVLINSNLDYKQKKIPN